MEQILLVSAMALIIAILLNTKVYIKYKYEFLNPHYFTLKNSHPSMKSTAVLFGFNENRDKANFGSDSIVSVKGNNSDYGFILNDSAVSPFSINKIRLLGGEKDLENLVISIKYKEADESVVIPVFVNSYPFLNRGGGDFVKDIPIRIDVNGGTEIYFKMNPDSQIHTFMYYTKDKYKEQRLIRKIFSVFENKRVANKNNNN